MIDQLQKWLESQGETVNKTELQASLLTLKQPTSYSDLKKELSDYSRINPPTTCAPPVVEVCPDPCPAPEPLACLAADDVTASGTFG